MDRSASTSIALCMIVKNEAPIIDRCLASVRNFIDSWYIIDTGSTDETPDKIVAALQGIPGTLQRRPWVNFGHNRTELVNGAKDAADYLLLLDADMELKIQASFSRELTADAYLLRYEGNLDYSQTLLVRGDLDWKYYGSTHEYIHSPECRNIERLEAVTIVHHHDGSSRATKLDRDLELLYADLQAKPDDARTVFYLAQTHQHRGEHSKAVQFYLRRVEMGGWMEESWYAALQAGKLLLESTDPLQGTAWLLRAAAMRPSRAEPYYWLARHFRLEKSYELAYQFAQAAVKVEYPRDTLFIDRDVYAFRAKDELAISAYYLGQFVESAKLCGEILADGACGPSDRERVQRNLRFAAERNKPLVFGLGTGRCGTKSLAKLLSYQSGSCVTHEYQRLPWLLNEQRIRTLLTQIHRFDGWLVGDVAFYYLPYVEWIVQRIPDAVFICLKRSLQDTVRSYMAWTGDKNHWSDRNGEHWNGHRREDRYDECYPKFNLEKEAAIARYWQHYYHVADYLQEQFPQQFRVFFTDDLNSEAGQTEILTFAGISKRAMRLKMDMHEHALLTSNVKNSDT